MKRITQLLVILLGVSAILSAQPTTEKPVSEKTYSIGISKMVSHPALDAIEQGIIDYLHSTDLSCTFDLQNCNADISTAIAIAQKFKSDNKDLVVGIATPPAQALAQVITDKPVVFGAITDPLAAGLVANYKKTEDTNIAGVSDLNPLKLQLETYFRIVKPKRLGMIYTSSEANGVVQMEMAKQICKDNGVEFVAAAISNSSEVKMAAQSIIGRIDAMYIAIDNTVVSAIPSVSEVCSKAGIPLFNTDTTSSEGIDFLMSWGFNYYTVGVETGKVVERILKGEKPRDIGAIFFEDPSQFELWFNLDVAKKLGITIPDDLRASAKLLIQDGKKVIQQ
ncbi:MAG: ABC transporter substrate-binding protein [Sphaerochaeta sp.]|jgi:putative ABC transport system substrate-binding protein|uniref:ABC transporter substrate-binding protein n=1 Tax=Sphaerochaeta sp. TaxID=1972642 RepID=UPI003D113494